MSTDVSSSSVIILDTGAGLTKVGYAGDETPKVVMPSLSGEILRKSSSSQNTSGNNNNIKRIYGSDVIESMPYVQSHQSVLSPTSHVTDWDDIERFWRYALESALEVDDMSLHPVVVTEAPLASKNHREKLTQLLFEEFKVPGVFVANQAIMSMYAVGRISGVVVDIGHHTSHVVPIVEGYAYGYATERMNIAGKKITQLLERAILEHVPVKNKIFPHTLTDIKEQSCFVALEHEKRAMNERANEGSMANYSKKYNLPDGQCITLDDRLRSHPTEVLFEPSLFGYEIQGIHEQIINCIQRVDSIHRKDLYSNIILSGGTTVLPGFVRRLDVELSAVAPQTALIEVIAQNERVYGSWIGSSILATLSTFQQLLVKKDEYNAWGPSAIHRKCY